MSGGGGCGDSKTTCLGDRVSGGGGCDCQNKV